MAVSLAKDFISLIFSFTHFLILACHTYHYLTLGCLGSKMGYQLCQCSPLGILVQFAYLTRDRCLSLFTTDLRQLLQRLDQAVWRLINDGRLLLCRNKLQTSLSSFLLRQEALKIEPVARQSRVH